MNLEPPEPMNLEPPEPMNPHNASIGTESRNNEAPGT
jgi:hypothetical protein